MYICEESRRVRDHWATWYNPYSGRSARPLTVVKELVERRHQFFDGDGSPSQQRLEWINECIASMHCMGPRADRAMWNLANMKGGERVVDVGCGLGGPAIWLASRGCRVFGFDVTNEYLAVARWLARSRELCVSGSVHFQLGDVSAHNIGVRGVYQYDIVWTQTTMCNVRDRRVAYGHIERFLAPGGKGIFLDILKHDSYARYPVPWASSEGDDRTCSLEETISLAEEKNLRVVQYKDVSVQARRWFLEEKHRRPRRWFSQVFPWWEQVVDNQVHNIETGVYRYAYLVVQRHKS